MWRRKIFSCLAPTLPQNLLRIIHTTHNKQHNTTSNTTQHNTTNNTIKLGAKFQSSEHAVFLKLCPMMMWWFFLAQMWMWKTAGWFIDWWKDSASWFFCIRKPTFESHVLLIFNFCQICFVPTCWQRCYSAYSKRNGAFPGSISGIFLLLSHCKVWSG